MRSAISLLLLLLFSMCGVEARSTQTEVQPESQDTAVAAAAASAAEVSTQLDVSAELKELRDMVMEQSSLLKEMEAENTAVQRRLVASEIKVAVLERVTAEQQTELTGMKTDMMNMKMENAAAEERLLAKMAVLQRVTTEQQTELAAVKERLVTSETKVASLEMANDAQDERLSAGETAVEELKMDNAAQTAELAAVKTRLADNEAEVDTLKMKITKAPKVAFSAANNVSGYTEAVNGDLNLVFKKMFTNVGEGYNSLTGVFTAPVKGVYYFRYTFMDINRSGHLSIRVLMNGKKVMVSSAHEASVNRLRGSNGFALQLEEGDTVNLQLFNGHRVYDEGNDFFNNFSGFLLFPL